MSFFFDMVSAKYSTTANLAISEGWKVRMSPMPIHRRALFRTWPIPGISTSTSSTTDRIIRGFASAR